jgi:hypothetical protein
VFPLEEWGVPVACEVPVGSSMGQEIGTLDYDFRDEYNDNYLTLEGLKDDIEDLMINWRSVYKVVELVEEFKDEEKEVYVPWSDLFLPKKSKISMYSGQKRKKVKERYHIIVR